jgi:hypothetical protein
MMEETDPNYPKDIYSAAMLFIRSAQRAARERNLRAKESNTVNDKNGQQKPDNK